MTVQIALLLGTISAALVLFTLEKVPAEVTGLGILLFLVLTGLLPADQAFAGFGSDVVILMLGLLILMAALDRTGVTDHVARAILRHTGASASRLLVVVIVAAVAVGGLMSNTAATAFFLPIVIGMARKSKLSPAKFLMPLAFASILASSITLIGTSTNLLVSGLMTRYGLAPMGMFELSPAGIPIAIAGSLYLLTLGRRLIPDRFPQEEIEDISVRLYLSEILIPPGSPLIGKTLAESGLGRDLDLTVLRVISPKERNAKESRLPQASTRLGERDVLLVQGRRENILHIKEEAGIDIKPEIELSGPDLEGTEVGLMEVILLPGSRLIGRTLRGLNFRHRYRLQVLAINRYGAVFRRKMSRIRLRVGDVLIVQGDRNQVRTLERQGVFRILNPIERRRPNRARAPLALAIFAGVLALVTFEVLTLPVATLLGALLAFLTRCITPEEAYGKINWKVLILIACLLGLGTAMEITGTAQFLAHVIVRLMGEARPFWLLTGFFALTVLLTQPMSNQAAAAVVLPVAIQTADQLALNPRSFAIIIALAASCSFLTPLEPACLLVYGPGRYQFADFPRVGLVPTLLIYAIAVTLVPLLWPV